MVAPEFRELLELSSLYLAFANQQFTSAEQSWVDANLGQGTSDRFIEQIATIDWQQTLARTQVLASSLPAQEKALFNEGIRDWLMQLLAIEGIKVEELQRLDEYLAFLGVPTSHPQEQHALPSEPEPAPTPPNEPEQAPPPNEPEQAPPPIEPEQAPPPRKGSAAPAKEILIDQDGERYGPYSLEKINNFLKEGRISSTADAWHKGISDWVPITEIEGVVAPTTDGPPPRPANKPAAVEPPPRRKLQPTEAPQSETESGEKKYYEDSENGVLVTSTRYVVEDELGNPVTYAIKNITSVTTGTYVIEAEKGFFRTCRWFFLILAFLFFLDYMDKKDWTLLLAAGFAVAAVYGFFSEEQEEGYTYYSVDNITASGNQQSYTSIDMEEIVKIVKALNKAIINS